MNKSHISLAALVGLSKVLPAEHIEFVQQLDRIRHTCGTLGASPPDIVRYQVILTTMAQSSIWSNRQIVMSGWQMARAQLAQGANSIIPTDSAAWAVELWPLGMLDTADQGLLPAYQEWINQAQELWKS